MPNQGRAGRSVVLHRRKWGGYHFTLLGENYVIERQTDGTLGSAVRWSVRRASDNTEVANKESLGDVRQWASRIIEAGSDA